MSSPNVFLDHTLETAPAETQPALRGTQKLFGFIPAAMARMAESPSLIEGFGRLMSIWDRSSLGPIEREVVATTVGHDVGCGVCVALHSATLARSPETAALVEPLRTQTPLEDPRLEALRRFTRVVLAQRGRVADHQLAEFLAAGFSRRQALDVVLGIATYTLSTFANRMTEAPLDAPFEPFRWEEEARPLARHSA